MVCVCVRLSNSLVKLRGSQRACEGSNSLVLLLYCLLYWSLSMTLMISTTSCLDLSNCSRNIVQLNSFSWKKNQFVSLNRNALRLCTQALHLKRLLNSSKGGNWGLFLNYFSAYVLEKEGRLCLQSGSSKATKLNSCLSCTTILLGQILTAINTVYLGLSKYSLFRVL